MKTVLQGGSIVRPDGVFAADIAFEDGRIVDMAERLPTDGADVVDATNCYVLPGGVDVSVRCPVDRLAETGRAAVRGGTTCCGWLSPAADDAAALPATLPTDMLRLPALGDGAPSGSGPHWLDMERLNDTAGTVRILREAARAEACALLRPELPAVSRLLVEELRAAGRTDVRSWPEAAPVYVEEEAVRLALTLARAAGCRAGLLPLSAREALDAVRDARERGQAVWAASSPQYLLLDESAYEEGAAEGLKYAMNPPLRDAGQARHLWEALASGLLDAVVSDHCETTFEAKWEAGAADAFACPSGVPGVETRLPLLFSEGVLKGRLTLSRLVQCLCANPARFLGCGERKGDLRPGYDADICLLDPTVERLITARRLHQGDYTPFEGLAVRGWPRAVWARGRRVVGAGDGGGDGGQEMPGMWLAGGEA